MSVAIPMTWDDTFRSNCDEGNLLLQLVRHYLIKAPHVSNFQRILVRFLA